MKRIKHLFSLRWQDGVTLVVLMLAALDVSLLLQPIGADDNHASLIYVLAVFLVARYTNGYLCGLLASIFSAMIVNYAFVAPYYSFNLEGVGYPLSFATLFSVSIMTSVMTAHIKEQESFHIEAERERLRSNLLRAVGHDLRTPLTSIAGSASALMEQENLSPQEQRKLLENIRDESEWMVRMVENLLSITKVGNAAFHLQKSPEPVEEIVGASIEKFQAHFPQVSIEAEVPDEWFEVPMDGLLIEQVLYNLMENAVIHGHADQVTVQVKRQGRRACFFLKDNGLGLQQQPGSDGDFEQVSLGSNGKKQNMGIGLLVCRDIVQVHGGTFQSGNRPGGGAQFSFTLPLEVSDHEKKDPCDRG